jgi:multiple sugar transport system permease protein
MKALAGESLAARAFIVLAYVILSLWAIALIFPLYWMVVTAIKPPFLVITTPPQLVPQAITFHNFEKIIDAGGGRWAFNTLVVAVIETIGQLFIASTAGYVFAKKDFPLKNAIFWLYISSMIVPIYAIIVPLYWVIHQVHLTNTYLALILPGLAAPFGVFLMRQFIQTLPTELIDAARIDGCTEWGIYQKVILPLSVPGLTVLAIFSFTGAWNAFFWPLVVTTSNKMFLLTVGVYQMQLNQYNEGVLDYGILLAGATLSAIPLFIVFFSLQRYFLRGITLGALKG